MCAAFDTNEEEQKCKQGFGAKPCGKETFGKTWM